MTAQKLSPVNSTNLEEGEQTLQRQLIQFQGSKKNKFVKFTPKQAAIAGRVPPKKIVQTKKEVEINDSTAPALKKLAQLVSGSKNKRASTLMPQ